MEKEVERIPYVGVAVFVVIAFVKGQWWFVNHDYMHSALTTSGVPQLIPELVEARKVAKNFNEWNKARVEVRTFSMSDTSYITYEALP